MKLIDGVHKILAEIDCDESAAKKLKELVKYLVPILDPIDRARAWIGDNPRDLLIVQLTNLNSELHARLAEKESRSVYTATQLSPAVIVPESVAKVIAIEFLRAWNRTSGAQSSDFFDEWIVTDEARRLLSTPTPPSAEQCYSKQDMRDLGDAVKQLCKDFSDRQNRPYMGDVVTAIDYVVSIHIDTPRDSSPLEIHVVEQPDSAAPNEHVAEITFAHKGKSNGSFFDVHWTKHTELKAGDKLYLHKPQTRCPLGDDCFKRIAEEEGWQGDELEVMVCEHEVKFDGDQQKIFEHIMGDTYNLEKAAGSDYMDSRTESAYDGWLSRYMYSNREAIAKHQRITEQDARECSVAKFLSVADDLIDENPYLYVEVARTRHTDWMAWLRKKPDGELIACGQGSTAEEACSQALEAIAKASASNAEGDNE